MSDALDVTTKLSVPRAINLFLIENRIVIKDNPAISPDLTLDAPGLTRELRGEVAMLSALPDGRAAAAAAKNVIFYPRSEVQLSGGKAFIVESRRNGDAAWVIKTNASLPFDGADTIQGIRVVPLTWDNLIVLKDLLLTQDPSSTVFPKADEALARASLGIDARFTTLQWPAVAWTMKALQLPLTASQNSVPREMVCDVDAMLDARLAEIPCPSLGANVTEGHQGQSLQGTSHAAVVTNLKLGFHHHRIPWGFSVDHEPIGGRFGGMDESLVEGGLFASHIAYDLSPELSARPLVADDAPVEDEFTATVDAHVHQTVVERLAQLGLSMDVGRLKRLEIYFWPAIKKMALRNAAHTRLRQAHFRSPEGRRFFKEVCLDGLTDQTTPDALAVCLALSNALGVKVKVVTPNIDMGDGQDPRARMQPLAEMAKKFDVSLGFNSGNGKLAETAQVCGDALGRDFALKTSDRYTHGLGAALAASKDEKDRQLWRDWFAFTRKLAVESAFSKHETRRQLARAFVTKTLEAAGQNTTGIFDSPAGLEQALATLRPSPDHMFWTKYAFLFVLAGEGSTAKLADHSPAGYQQRARLYSVSDEAKLGFAKNVARDIMALAEITGSCPSTRIKSARESLEAIKTYAELTAEVA